MSKFVFLVLVFAHALTAQAACETERRALALCETTDVNQCVVDSDCSRDETCRSGRCIEKPNDEVSVICTCKQVSSDVYLVRNSYVGSRLVSSDRIMRVTSTQGNSIEHLLSECYDYAASHRLCK